MRCAVAVGPTGSALVEQAIVVGGGTVVGVQDEPDALVWLGLHDAARLREALHRAPSVRWVQLPFAGVEEFTEVLDPALTWTCAKGVYSEPVAEHVLALALAGLRSLPERARATTWGEQRANTLYDASVVILGAGGITTALLALLAPFRAQVTVVRRHAGTPLPGAARTVGIDELDSVLPGAQLVVLALALTPETEGVIGARQLAAMDPSAWLVNVGRGRHVDTDALLAALAAGAIGGAALDVTDPEPLPDGHPLWSAPNCLITPHSANPWQTAQPLLSRRISDNVALFLAGRPLLGLVDLQAGY